MLSAALDILFPPQCLECNARVPSHGALCLTCWNAIRFIADPLCNHCGLPFDFDLGERALCADCMQDAPAYAQARAVFRYDEASRGLITKLKYADQTQLASIYGVWLAKAGKELILSSDVIVPVPLHFLRFLQRRYNQSALLAYALSKQCALPMLPDGLQRIRRTKPQPGLTRRQRQENVSGAFAVLEQHRAAIKGKNVLLVDDVMTTGATLEHCSKTLLKAGAMRVNVVTLARKVD